MSINISTYKLKTKDGKSYFIETYLKGIHGVMNFMKKVIHGDELYSTSYRRANGKPMTTTSSLGKHLKDLPAYGRLFSSDYKFSPLIEFFLEEYRQHPIQDYLFPSLGPDRLGIDLFNNFVTSMRKNAMAKKLKKHVADWESKSKKNMARLIAFEAELFSRHARLMVVRLDLYYHAAIFSAEEIDGVISDLMKRKEFDQAVYRSGQDLPYSRPIVGRIALEEVQRDRKRLFTNMKGKPSLFRHLVGYVWRIEFGRAAGYHLHVTFFFNGSDVRKHEHMAHQIGLYWKDDITKGRGYFENCNFEKVKYSGSWALGQIDHWDTNKRENLRGALSYFYKTNQMVQVVPYAGCRLFGCGFVHRQCKVRGGRPRMRVADGDNQPRL